MHRPLAARPNDAADAKPAHDPVAALGVRDRAAQQRTGFAIEHRFSNYRRAIAGARALPRRIAGLACQEGAAAWQALRLLRQFLLHMQRICSKIFPHSDASFVPGPSIRFVINHIL